mmetsp:Transcript_22466/g.48922  ORF Transcript_22466/g.48922 Transcript_22466/m.48922 type:complete len:425 (-) Transcript_22466:102-1376(-)
MTTTPPPYIPQSNYFGLHINGDGIDAQIVTDSGGVQVQCQNLQPDVSTTSIEFQKIEWSFSLCLDPSEFQNTAQVDTAANVLMNYFEDQLVQAFLKDCVIQDDWDVVGAYFEKPHTAACEATTEQPTVDCTTYMCRHSYLLTIAESNQRRQRRALEQSTAVQEEFQRKLELLNSVSNPETLSRLLAFNNNVLSSSGFGDLMSFLPGVDELTDQGVDNVPETTTTATTAATTTVVTTEATTTTTTTTTNSGVNSALGNDENTSSGSSSNFNTPAIMGCVGAVVVLVIALMFVVGHKRRQAQKKRRDEMESLTETDNLHDLKYAETNSSHGDTSPDQGEENLFAQSWMAPPPAAENNNNNNTDNTYEGSMYRQDYGMPSPMTVTKEESQPFVVHDEKKEEFDNGEGVEVESTYLQQQDGYFCSNHC